MYTNLTHLLSGVISVITYLLYLELQSLDSSIQPQRYLLKTYERYQHEIGFSPFSAFFALLLWRFKILIEHIVNFGKKLKHCNTITLKVEEKKKNAERVHIRVIERM